jgi:hypothetical protein
LKGTLKKPAPLLLIGVAIGVLVLSVTLWRFRNGKQISEISVKVVELGPPENHVWSVPKPVVPEQPGKAKRFVLRVKHLRAERVTVEVAGDAHGRILIRSHDLRPGDVLVLQTRPVPAGQAVMPTAGLSEERLILLTVEAGMASATARDLTESLRFISPDYNDESGFDRSLMRKLLKRAYEEFDEPRIELAEPPKVQVKGNRAVVEAKVRLSAIFNGRRNYILGDHDLPNHIFVHLDKSNYGWKVSAIKGLKPLGFEEKFLRLLGGDIGLPLTEAERLDQKQACMPCRERMSERFGPTN